MGSLTPVSVDLQWTSSGQQQVTYQISLQRDTSIGCPFEDDRNLTVTNGLTGAQVSGLLEDSRYLFTVTASNPAGSSEVSNTVAAMTEKAGEGRTGTKANIIIRHNLLDNMCLMGPRNMLCMQYIALLVAWTVMPIR